MAIHPHFRHLLGVLVLLFFCWEGRVFAQPQNGKPAAEDWMTFYYLHPSPERLPDEVRAMSKAGLLAKKESEPPITVFFSQVLAQNPQKIAEWMASLDSLPEAEKKVLYNAIWFSQTKEGAGYFASKGIKDYVNRNPPDVLKLEANDSAVLDMLWGYFLATGKEEPVRRIISAFNLSSHAGALEKFKTSQKTEQDRKEAYLDLTFKAACWSLKSNYQQHKRVKEICEALLKGKDLNPTERLWVEQMGWNGDNSWRQDGALVADKPNMKSWKGFGAQLFLTENGQYFEDWNKPETPKLRTTDKARRNVPLFTVIEFIDPGTDAAGAADVTADVTVQKPDGSVYFEPKKVICWKQKYSVPAHNLQLAHSYVGIRIEPQDPSGVYTVEAIVRDNIKRATLPLKVLFTVP